MKPRIKLVEKPITLRGQVLYRDGKPLQAGDLKAGEWIVVTVEPSPEPPQPE